MSWPNVRASMVSTIEALTPTTTSRGAPTYRHVAGQEIEEAAADRAFVVRMASPPTQVGQVINGTSWRWLTDVDIAIYYVRGRNVEDDEDRMAEDAVQIQQALLVKSGHHANVEGVVASGDGYAATDIEPTPERNYVMHVGLTVHHL